MELYDKQFVFFEWDDKLEGKKGFFSDNINDLKQHVKDNDTSWFGEICHNVNTNTDYPFGFIDDSGSSHCLRFCYYDPHYEVKKAFMEGKKIEMEIDGEWFPATDPIWNPDTEYRIKDECTACLKHDTCANPGIKCKSYCTEVKDKYVPFDSVEELIECWEKKFPGNANRPEGTMPLIWIKSKHAYRVYLITYFLFEQSYGQDVGTYDSNYRLEDLFKDFTFLDGSIIGKRG
jgi:hypothetical protein